MPNVGSKTMCIMGDMQMANGLKGVTLDWFSSYLSNTQSRVEAPCIGTYSQLC